MSGSLPHAMSLSADDVLPLLAEVQRFVGKRVAAACAQPHIPLSADQLSALTQEAASLGLLPTQLDELGVALWEHTDSEAAQRFNLQMLRAVATVNAGVAWAWHRHALLLALARQLDGLTDTVVRSLQQGRGGLLTTGHYGLARGALAHHLQGRPLAPDDQTLLTDWLDHQQHNWTLYAPADWQVLLRPVWHQGDIHWQACLRGDLLVLSTHVQHGLDELCAFQVQAHASAMAQSAMLTGKRPCAELYARILKMDLLGMLAIADGAMVHGQRLAVDYAHLRRQGGAVIAQHAAVQHMLADIALARQDSQHALQALCLPLSELDLGAVVAVRARVHPLLCDAASQAIQVHGGVGYMRDTGIEKIWRDQRMLQQMAGGAREARSLLAAWAGACA
jgi:acyl-CoA dehydrogenase